MAKHSIEILGILRRTAENIQKSEQYQWGHMGACNCGFLAQEVTRLHKSEIHGYAMRGRGDWNEQLIDYCPSSGLPFDDVISALLNAGFDIDDLKHLERLSDPVILEVAGCSSLEKNRKENVILYLKTWANVVEEHLIGEIRICLPETDLTMDS